VQLAEAISKHETLISGEEDCGGPKKLVRASSRKNRIQSAFSSALDQDLGESKRLLIPVKPKSTRLKWSKAAASSVKEQALQVFFIG
jgi:hypothetical protein